MVAMNFDANQYNPQFGFPIIPSGWYLFAVTKSEQKVKKGDENKSIDQQAKMLVFTCTILEGELKEANCFINFNIKHENAQTVTIAFNQLAALSTALGRPLWQQTEELHGIPFLGRVELTKDEQGRENSNIKEIKSAPSMQQAPQMPPQQPPMQQPAPQPVQQQTAPMQPQQPMQPPQTIQQVPPQQPWGTQQPTPPNPSDTITTQQQPPMQQPVQPQPQPQQPWPNQPPAQPQAQPAAVPWGRPTS